MVKMHKQMLSITWTKMKFMAKLITNYFVCVKLPIAHMSNTYVLVN